MLIKNKKIVLFLIILLAFILRFYRLNSYPALNADEAAIGYNVYSLLQTGRDEHGNSWPLHFQSFNDYKPGLFFYLVLPFVKFLGLNEWAVRIPGALLGVTTILVVYFLVKELGISAPRAGGREKLAIISSFFLAISPWHIHFSRGGWEVNAATFFITCGIWLFLKSLKNFKYFAFCLLPFALSLYTYHAARLVVPLLGLGFIIIYCRQLKAKLKPLLMAGLIAGVLLLPLVADLLKPGAVSRATGVGLFADPGPLARINEQRGEHANYQGLLARVLHNKVVNYGLALTENWGEHFWGEFLFLSGDAIQRNKVPETGQLYLFDLVFILVGLLAIVKGSKGWKPVLWWLVVAPMAAALTFQSPHALRAQNMVIPLTIISAYGLVRIIKWLKKNIKPQEVLIACYFLLIAFITWNFARYLHLYWVHVAKEYPFSSQYGLKELVSFVQDNAYKYDKVIVTDRYDQPYILFLFYLKYPPAKFQADHYLTAKDKFGFSTVQQFDKFYFGPIDFDQVQPENPNSLIIGTDEEIPADEEIPNEANIIKKIYFPKGDIAFEIVEN